MSFLDFAKQKPRLILLGAVVATALTMGFTFTKVFVFPSSGGSLSPYLIGYFDLRTTDCIGGFTNGIRACAETGEDTGSRGNDPGILTNRTDAGIDLTNPTTTSLLAVITIFDQNGAFLDCDNRTVGPNETGRVYVNDDVLSANGDGKRGVIKIVTLLSSDHTKVQAGVKGWLTHYVTESSDNNHQIVFSRQSQLQQVPVEVLKKDNLTELFNIVRTGCDL